MNKKYLVGFFLGFIVEEIQLFKSVKIENIFYDLDKWCLRPESATELDKLVNLLQENLEVSAETGSYTDSKAGDNIICSV